MNKLELCQRWRQETGVSGDESTTADATGMWKRGIGYIEQAYQDIQLEREDWNFMRGEKSFNTIQDQNEYPYASAPISLTDLARWKEDSFRIYYQSVGDEHPLQYMNYDEFRHEYLYGTFPTTPSYPTVITVSPSDSLILALPPDGVYTVTGEYFKTVSKLDDDTDIPVFPERFHMLIVYRAMIKYGLWVPAPEIVSYAKAEYDAMFEKMESDETPDITVDRNFA
ncbi:MAG: hypothetical protein H6937_09490 [Burkholderiales bacterium]|nr:hypothetical protein [Burkholderiales bacterium]